MVFVMQMRLCDLNVNDRAEVVEVSADGDIRRRFLDIGLIEGTEVECIGKSPSGDPSAYFIRGAAIAIRKKDAAEVLVRLLGGEQNGN